MRRGVVYRRLFFCCDVMLIRVSGEEERQRAVAGDVAGGAEAVLQGEDGEDCRKHFRFSITQLNTTKGITTGAFAAW